MDGVPTTRLATVDDAERLAVMLHDFNTEYDTASPGVDFLVGRLRALLPCDRTIAILVFDPEANPTATPTEGATEGTALGLALVTLRPNVWYQGQVALLDELYVVPDRRSQGLGSALIAHLLAWAREVGVSAIEIGVDEPDVDAQRFYERHGFAGVDVATGERAFWYSMELTA